MIKHKKWVITNTRGKYLVFEIDKNLDKPWNSRMTWVREIKRATRYPSERYVDVAIGEYNIYTHGQPVAIKMEIWE